jgi:hypothetical protein
VHLGALKQVKAQHLPGEEIHLGYFRETFKMRDQQVSPMMYVANLNGLQLVYARTKGKNYWQAKIKAGIAELLGPSLGVRAFYFSEEGQPLFLVPTLYSGELNLSYSRKFLKKQKTTSWLGVQIQENMNYADGLALTTWVMNTLALNAIYQAQLQLNNRHSFLGEVSIPVLTAVSRLPYSNVVSKPDVSNTRAFLQNTTMAGPFRYLRPQLAVAYRLKFSKRFAFQAMYNYSLMRYPEPRLIRAASHTGTVSLIYQWHYPHH